MYIVYLYKIYILSYILIVENIDLWSNVTLYRIAPRVTLYKFARRVTLYNFARSTPTAVTIIGQNLHNWN